MTPKANKYISLPNLFDTFLMNQDENINEFLAVASD